MSLTDLDPYSSISSFVISVFSFDSLPLACRGLAILIPPAFTVKTLIILNTLNMQRLDWRSEDGARKKHKTTE